MLKSIEGIYNQGKIILEENPEDIPPNTKVIVTFLTSDQTPQSENKILSNQEIDELLIAYRLEKKRRPVGLCKGKFRIADNFNEPLPNNILSLFE